ncbi:hypothetical protein GOP47_0028664 [Adiantum capillus-veneris]|nr:hypothetical protein GOP47_0028664 [Adiantum capillus-veneris]
MIRYERIKPTVNTEQSLLLLLVKRCRLWQWHSRGLFPSFAPPDPPPCLPRSLPTSKEEPCKAHIPIGPIATFGFSSTLATITTPCYDYLLLPEIIACTFSSRHLQSLIPHYRTSPHHPVLLLFSSPTHQSWLPRPRGPLHVPFASSLAL